MQLSVRCMESSAHDYLIRDSFVYNKHWKVKKIIEINAILYKRDKEEIIYNQIPISFVACVFLKKD